jgi:hypothetical protein
MANCCAQVALYAVPPFTPAPHHVAVFAKRATNRFAKTWGDAIHATLPGAFAVYARSLKKRDGFPRNDRRHVLGIFTETAAYVRKGITLCVPNTLMCCSAT